MLCVTILWLSELCYLQGTWQVPTILSSEKFLKMNTDWKRLVAWCYNYASKVEKCLPNVFWMTGHTIRKSCNCINENQRSRCFPKHRFIKFPEVSCGKFSHSTPLVLASSDNRMFHPLSLSPTTMQTPTPKFSYPQLLTTHTNCFTITI